MSAEKLNPVNPGPLGLLGFGMTTILLNLHNAEIIPLSIVIVAMGFCPRRRPLRSSPESWNSATATPLAAPPLWPTAFSGGRWS